MDHDYTFDASGQWLTSDSASSNTQKPTDELYAAFKQNFPGVGPVHDATTSSSAVPPISAAAMNDALVGAALHDGSFGDHDETKDHDGSDSWRFTPSILDPNAFSFSNFGNHGFSFPTPGGINAVYHNQSAGDLHTPGMAFQLGTPLSMPIAESSLSAGAFDGHGFNPQMFQNQNYQNANMFHQQQQQTYAPSMLVHQDSGYGAMDGSPDNETDMATGLGSDQISGNQVHNVSKSLAAPVAPGGEKFRYNVTLNAPTAMTRHPDEIPITYLNKGQAYTLSIVDSTPVVAPSSTPLKYRTVIRISFEDEQQRQRPSACWQLWKEGRGLAEAHQRGGKLQAVEYVDPHPGAEEDPRRPRIELESASFDCFAVQWTPSIATSSSECSIAVRFNFLSTDFSHSKGVKGIPVRLCAKTEIASAATEDTSTQPEVCFCKVKLFRDHGAERKLSNDVAHVKKTIDKLKQQIAQAEAGFKDAGKRKRTASMAGKMSDRPAKMPKHKRTWSISSQGSQGRPAIEDDLHQKLAAVQDMFTSTRPVSVLYLKGLEEDDPDLFPVSLPGDSGDLAKIGLHRTNSWDQRQSENVSPTGSSIGSPEASTRSNTGFKIPPSRTPTAGNWPLSATLPSTNFSAALEQSKLSGPVKIKRQDSATNDEDEFEAVGIDPTYIPPEQPVKPVACFFILVKGIERGYSDDFYRAVYLTQRTIKHFISGVASKCEVDPARVERTIRINKKGLQVFVDGEVIRELPEGQDMVIEFKELDSGKDLHIKQETLRPGTEDKRSTTPLGTTPLEMRLIY